MKQSMFRTFRPSLDTLEDRCVPALGIWVPGFGDPELTAVLRQTGAGTQVYIDGSNYHDVVQIVNFDRAAGFMEIKLSRWLDHIAGTQVGQTETVRLDTRNLQAYDSIHVEGKEGTDHIINTTSATMVAFGGGDNDYFHGGSARDRIFGNSGNDVMYGWGGDDDLFGDNADGGLSAGGSDALIGGAGKDWLAGERGNDSLSGEGGDDTLLGDAGNDNLLGNGGQDRLFGGADNDYLDAGYKAMVGSFNVGEYLEGGQGKDTFVRHKSFSGRNDPDVFTDYSSPTGDRTKIIWHL
jgi:Ca2+-binding RTX toxin-like protein